MNGSDVTEVGMRFPQADTGDRWLLTVLSHLGSPGSAGLSAVSS